MEMYRKGQLEILIWNTRRDWNINEETVHYGYGTRHDQDKGELNCDWVECRYVQGENGYPCQNQSVRSGNLLKGVILLSKYSHSSGMKGVIMGSRLSDDVALLSRVRGQSTESAPVFTFVTQGTVITSRGAVPGITISLPGFTLSSTGTLKPV